MNTRFVPILAVWAFTVAAPWAVADQPDIAVVRSEDRMADLFAPVRRDIIGAGDTFWMQAGVALEGLETIEGAVYVDDYGVVALIGEPATTVGPYHLDDLMVVLKAKFFARTALGMTIEPRSSAGNSSTMTVEYRANCENTAFGWLMFECDRLLKSASSGKDNLTGKTFRLPGPGFRSMLELNDGSRRKANGRWNRFWLDLDRADELTTWRDGATKSNGSQPVVFATENAISIANCDLYLRTQVMHRSRGKLVPVKGSHDPAANQFISHFNANFDAITDQFPEFARLRLLARLIPIADWLEKSDIPLDFDFVQRFQQAFPVVTPTITPALKTSAHTRHVTEHGTRIQTSTSVGGVSLRPATFFAADSKGQAAELEGLVRNTFPEHLSHVSWIANGKRGPRRIVLLPTLATAIRKPSFRKRVGSTFQNRKGTSDDTSPAAILPTLPSPATERSETVPRMQISLNRLDQVRARIRGPPGEKVAATIPIDISPSGGLRIESVPRIAINLGLDNGNPNAPVRGPPILGDWRHELAAERSESVPTIDIDLRPNTEPIVQPTEHAASARKDENTEIQRSEFVRRADVPLTPQPTQNDLPWGLALFSRSDGRTTYNLPRLLRHPTQTFRLDAPKHIEAQLVIGIISPIGDILVRFDKKVHYVPATKRLLLVPLSQDSQGVVGLDLEKNILVMENGTQVEFDQKGNVAVVCLSDATQIRMTHTVGPNARGHLVYADVTSTGFRATPGRYTMALPQGDGTPPPRPKTSGTLATAAALPAKETTDPQAPNQSASPVLAQDGRRSATEKRKTSKVEDVQAPKLSEDGGASSPVASESGNTRPGATLPVQANSSVEKARKITLPNNLELDDGDWTTVGPSIKLTSSVNGHWTARVRSVRAPVSAIDDPLWREDSVPIRVGAQRYMIGLMPNQGELRQGETAKLRLIITRQAAESVEAKYPWGTNLFVDVFVTQADGSSDRLSLPYTLFGRSAAETSYRQHSTTTLVLSIVGTLFLGLLTLLCLRKRTR